MFDLIPKTIAQTLDFPGTSQQPFDHPLFMFHPPFQSVIGTFMSVVVVFGIIASANLLRSALRAPGGWRGMHWIRKWAWVYAAVFWFQLALVYILLQTDDRGRLLGIIVFNLMDDVLLLASASWATFAAFRSQRQSVLYFIVFGALYFVDGIMSLSFGRTVLSLGIFVASSPMQPDFPTMMFAYLPKIVLGGMALVLGLRASSRGVHRS